MSSQGKEGLYKWGPQKSPAEVKVTKKSGGQQVGGASRPNTERRRGLGPEPKASLLPKPEGSPRQMRAGESRPRHQLLLGAPSRFTPFHASGAGKTGRHTGVNDIISKRPLTSRRHPPPSCRAVSAQATTSFGEASKSLSLMHTSPHAILALAKNGRNRPMHSACHQAPSR